MWPMPEDVRILLPGPRCPWRDVAGRIMPWAGTIPPCGALRHALRMKFRRRIYRVRKRMEMFMAIIIELGCG